MIRRNSVLAVWASLLVFVLVGCGPAVQPDVSGKSHAVSGDAVSGEEASWPIVQIITKTPERLQVGHGAVIGDGTLVVTAYHLVCEESLIGLHHMELPTTVVSRYLGDICAARIVAVDRELDLAVLEVPWVGHPAYKLATSEEINTTEDVAVLSLERIVEEYSGPLREDLQLNTTVFRRGVMSQLTFKQFRHLKKGWSGGPVLSRRSGHLMGGFNMIRRFDASMRFVDDDPSHPLRRRQAVGFASPAVAQAVSRAGKGHLLSQSAWVKRPHDASLATQSFCRSVREEERPVRNLPGAIDALKDFLEHRPGNSAAKLKLAGRKSESGQSKQAETIYKELIAEPDGCRWAPIGYGQFLYQRGRFEEALGQYDLSDFSRAEESCLVDCMVISTLGKKGRIDAAIARANEAIGRYSQNARLYGLRGLAFLQKGQVSQALDDLNKAVALFPDYAPLRFSLANALVLAGETDKAELHLRDAIDIDPDVPSGYLQLADLIMRKSPKNRNEAVVLLQRAQKLKASPQTAKAIQEMLDKLNEM